MPSNDTPDETTPPAKPAPKPRAPRTKKPVPTTETAAASDSVAKPAPKPRAPRTKKPVPPVEAGSVERAVKPTPKPRAPRAKKPVPPVEAKVTETLAEVPAKPTPKPRAPRAKKPTPIVVAAPNIVEPVEETAQVSPVSASPEIVAKSDTKAEEDVTPSIAPADQKEEAVPEAEQTERVAEQEAVPPVEATRAKQDTEEAKLELVYDDGTPIFPPNTTPIDIKEITESSIHDHDVEHKTRSKKRRRWITLGALLVVLVIAAVAFGSGDSASNNAPEPTTTSPAELSESDKQAGVSNLVEGTANVIGSQFVDQYGEESYATILFASDTANVDDNGKPATVGLATYSMVPSDFDIASSAAFFEESIENMDGDWKMVENKDAPEGIDSLYAVKLYDASENPSNPAIIDISYFTETENNPNKNITITISVTAY